MRRFLLVLAFFGCSNGLSQKINYSVQAGVNYTIIEDVSATPTITPIPTTSGYSYSTVNIGTVREVFKGNTGFFIGGKADLLNAKRFFLTSGLLLQTTRFNRVVVDHVDPATSVIISPITGQPIGTLYGNILIRDENGNIIVDPNGKPVSPILKSSPKLGDTEVFQLGVPILAGTRSFKEKLLVQLGLNFSFVLTAFEFKDRYLLFATTLESVKEKNTAAFNRFTVGLNLSTTYRITKKIGVQLSAIRNLSPVYRNNSEFAGSAYMNSFSGGINYVIAN